MQFNQISCPSQPRSTAHGAIPAEVTLSVKIMLCSIAVYSVDRQTDGRQILSLIALIDNSTLTRVCATLTHADAISRFSTAFSDPEITADDHPSAGRPVQRPPSEWLMVRRAISASKNRC